MIGKKSSRSSDKPESGARKGETLPCEWCGRLYKPDELVWVGSEQAWLCPFCRAEAETCGCAD